MSDKMKNLLIRTLSGVVLAAVVLGAIVGAQWSFAVLFALILVGGMIEFYSLAEKQGNNPQRLIGLVAGLVVFALNMVLVSRNPMLYEVAGGLRGLFVFGLAFLLLLFPLMIICELYRKNSNPTAAIGTTFLGVFYVALPLALICHIPTLVGAEWNPWLVVAYIFIIWANDVFAYLVGISIGRHRLFERISPKKSWEGFVGGLLGAVAIGLLAGWILDANLWIWAGVAVVVAVTGVLGDLVESMFKRSAQVKDSGSIIPGHGGVLDRFDAMLLSAPFVYVYMLFVM